MTDQRDELSALDNLDATLRELHAFQCRVTDVEAITHAAAQALECLPAHSIDAKHRLEVARVKSLVTSATTRMRELLDEMTELIDSIEGPRAEQDESP